MPLRGAPVLRRCFVLVSSRPRLSTECSTKLDAAQASAQLLDPYPGKPRVTFKADGTFKITVFSDLHFGENPWDVWGPQQDVNSTRLMRIVLADEKPDYV